jgi:hypothetical protein
MIQLYQTDLSSLPAPQPGYQWAQVPGNPVPQMVLAKPSRLQQEERAAFPFILGGAILLTAWLIEGGIKKIKRPELPKIPMS